jgi:hypothetical protein
VLQLHLDALISDQALTASLDQQGSQVLHGFPAGFPLLNV